MPYFTLFYVLKKVLAFFSPVLSMCTKRLCTWVWIRWNVYDTQRAVTWGKRQTLWVRLNVTVKAISDKICILKAVWLLSLSHRMCCAASAESFSPAGLIAAAFLEPVSLLFTARACLCDDPLLLSQQEWNSARPIQAGFVGSLPRSSSKCWTGRVTRLICPHWEGN